MPLESPAWPPQVLAFGPPGTGVALAVEALTREGLRAAGWEAPPGPHPAEDGSGLDQSGAPVLLCLEAADASCLERGLPPWSEWSLSHDALSAAHALEEVRMRLFQARLRTVTVLDTTHLSAPVLKARVRQLSPYLLAPPDAAPVVVLESFGYPRGVPLDLGHCIDVRSLRNPYWEPSLRMLSGLEGPVQQFVIGQPLATRILGVAEELILSQLPELQARSRRVLRVAVGCTGGFHRSVAIAEELARRLSAAGAETLLWHRDLPERP